MVEEVLVDDCRTAVLKRGQIVGGITHVVVGREKNASEMRGCTEVGVRSRMGVVQAGQGRLLVLRRKKRRMQRLTMRTRA